jgi:site-specific DNA recombinase
MGFVYNGAATRQLRPRLDALLSAGALEHTRRHGVKLWVLTSTGRRQQPKRAVAYVRESTEEQGRGYSPDGQRQAIARYAADHGMQLTEEYMDFETGRLADKRPGFQRLIEDAMERRFGVVLVFHTSRFARNTVEAKRYKKLLRSELGIDVISVTQPLGADVDDPAAFLSESVHEIFDEYYSVSLSFWTRWGCARRPARAC